MSGRGAGFEAGARLRILVVDDNRDGADTLAMLVASAGYDVDVAYDGAAAVERALATRPDVVLLDIGLPKLDGYEVCAQIRSEPWANRVRILAITGWGTDTDRVRARDAGFDHHFVKPVDPDELFALLATFDQRQ